MNTYIGKHCVTYVQTCSRASFTHMNWNFDEVHNKKYIDKGLVMSICFVVINQSQSYTFDLVFSFNIFILTPNKQ